MPQTRSPRASNGFVGKGDTDDETGGVPSSQVGAALSVHFVRPRGIQGACSYLGDGFWSMKRRDLTEHSRVTARELRFCTILWF